MNFNSIQPLKIAKKFMSPRKTKNSWRNM